MLTMRTRGPACIVFAFVLSAGCESELDESIMDSSWLDASVDAVVVPPGEAELVIDPSLFDFGDVLVGETSSPLALLVENRGTAASGPIEIELGGVDASSFRVVTDACDGVRLDAGDQCEVTVVFAPETEGERSAMLTARAGASVVSATLDGTGASEASLSVSPSPFDFGDVEIGSPRSQTFTLSYSGSGMLGPLVVDVGGLDASQFTRGTDECSGVALSGGESCTVEVSYAPSLPGSHTAILQATASPGQTVSAALQGRGAHRPPLRLLPDPADLGAVVVGSESATVEVTLTNPAAGATGVLSHSLSGVDAASFRIVTSTCEGVRLPGGETCTISVRFAPTSPGARVASLDVTDGSYSVASSLVGEGLWLGDPIIEPSVRDFGDARLGVIVGPQTFTLRNTGGMPTGVITTTIAGTNPSDFTIPSGADTCSGASIPVMGTCTIGVQFSPTAPGARAATLRATSATSPPLTAALSGTGLTD